jgi:uncharacterized repeat protein (TIGR04076 family)
MPTEKVIAEVIAAGGCEQCSTGYKFILPGQKPDDLCESGYAVLQPKAKALLYGTLDPRPIDGKALIRCPHSDPALWELRVEEVPDGEI